MNRCTSTSLMMSRNRICVVGDNNGGMMHWFCYFDEHRPNIVAYLRLNGNQNIIACDDVIDEVRMLMGRCRA